ncbi:M16 family metallopeptidase [Sphingobacterium sp. HJSM2_6]|uniref:M16 family metallopeptidase n=1 Tax=Sphingobacterium sp. HJSM2_6 TaxID=3366264 RepID=UPI003BCD1350
MQNRIDAPEVHRIEDVNLIKPELVKFSNGLQVFIFRAASQELLKAEFVFNNVFEQVENPVRNSALSAMLKEGTTRLTSAQIAEKIDFFGAYLVPEFSFDHNALTLYSLNKHVSAVLPIVFDVLTDAIIPDHELQTYKRNNKQNLQISLEKSDFLARRMFYEQLFGASRYGLAVSDKLLDGLSQEDLLSLYKQQIQPQNATLFLSGNITDEILTLFRNYFEKEWDNREPLLPINFTAKKSYLDDVQWVSKPNALQSSIRIGRQAIQRPHPDYPALQFVNTLFGGYFGSRLMSNIREEKGYTYNIGSVVANLNHAGFISIGTEVGNEYTEDTLKQIEIEMNRLKQERSTADEIELVRNYLLGGMLGSLESIFSHADKFKSVYFSGLDLDYYDYYTNVLKDINANQIQEIAQQYYHFDEMLKIVVGNKI